jgi:hypothetical protein
MATGSDQYKLSSKGNFAETDNLKNFKVKTSRKYLNFEPEPSDMKSEMERTINGMKI